MYRIYLAVIDVVPAAVVLVPLFLVLHVTVLGRNFKKSLLYCVFCLYLAAVFSLVGIPNVTDIRPELNMNLVPLVNIPFELKVSLLNVMLFLPFGFFLPILWENFRKMVPVACFGFGLSLTIELLQMLTYRLTDVNDLITNTLGAVVGFLLAKAVAGRYGAVSKSRGGAYALCALSFLVMFLIHPILSPLIWDRIL